MKVSKLDYVNDPFTVIDEAHKLTLAFAKMNRAFLQFEQLLGEPFDDPITHITHLYEYVTVGINSINDYTRSSSQDYISQFKQIQKLYILGQGFVDLRKLPFYSLVNKESYHPDEYAKYLVKAGDMTELFEHCISFLKGGIGSATTPNPQNFLGENVPSARYNNEQMRSFANY